MKRIPEALKTKLKLREGKKMIKKSTMSEILEPLSYAFNKRMNDKTFDVYYESLKDCEEEILKRAVYLIIKTNVHFPTIAEVLSFYQREKEATYPYKPVFEVDIDYLSKCLKTGNLANKICALYFKTRLLRLKRSGWDKREANNLITLAFELQKKLFEGKVDKDEIFIELIKYFPTEEVEKIVKEV